MTDTFIATSSEELGDLGTIVNDWKPSTAEISDTPAEQHPEELPLDLEKVVVWFTPEQYDTLYRAAEFDGVDIEQHVAQIVLNSLVGKIGAPRIFSPSFVSGKKTEGFITAPSFARDHLH